MRRLQFPQGPRRQQRRGSGGVQPRDAAAMPVRDLAAAPVRDAAAARATRSPTWMAELTLPAAELRRLRHTTIRIKSKTKVGGAGLTREVMEKIKEKWKTEEVVRVKVSGTPALNMRLFHEILEKLTGGVMLSRNKEFIVFYRGKDFLSSEWKLTCTEKDGES
ncbi:CRM-domain containing factor CFM3, chloroplastic/mitochondrial-like [Miscanthus floridulus]|uniref:CRM-domain containing factor CFM3, chloroplastic/mitochondrial-like n=1 Tax=Miscanthus floridulus TaxID=154761 RepID=UPI0034593920